MSLIFSPFSLTSLEIVASVLEREVGAEGGI